MGRGRTGQMQAYRTSAIRQSLLDAFRLPPTPPKPAKPPKVHIASDELVALIRGDKELRGMKAREIAELRGVAIHIVNAAVYYRDRVHIDPT